MNTKIQFYDNEEQRKVISHDNRLIEQINSAFEKLDSGKAVFISHEQAKNQMAERKTKIRNIKA
ncbi:hypothetical protein SG34_007175 [Thalassomonas viridans]|uniref:Uncharacterized protein n=1 Tax=Thalassomonas viridans TaxID=137584 RepID=A0AAE9Z5Y7_9GAMM|nr:hypothetical protein [Thalassomonas viridans]WDE06679.1 hypothetical protein SG34_007175 [Thalassomonas viridans]